MRYLKFGVTFGIISGLSYLGYTTYPKLDLISGFSAKSMASGIFVGQRSEASILLGDNDMDMIDLATNTIDRKSLAVTSNVYGLKDRKAIYREGLGVTLVDADFDPATPYAKPVRVQPVLKAPFPYGNAEPKDTLMPEVDYAALQKAVANAFDPKGAKQKRTRAVVVVYQDQLLAEHYDTGFDKNSKILGWSMTKSITSAYFGILQKQGKIDIYQPAPIADWKNDARKKITTNDLLHMNSGLAWEEDYGKISDVTKMLFLSKDMGQVQVEKEMVHAPNTHWNYSSGTSNVLSKILRLQFPTQQAYVDFWYSSLIDKIGMYSMLVESDMAGQFVGSSYAWATPRDWAKFGLLYLHRGNWNGEQIFEPSWVDYTTTPTNTSNGQYGGHFWLNAGGKYPDAPRDLYSCNGFQGQRVFIIPSKKLVIVRMGLADDKGFDFNTFLREILLSFREDSKTKSK